MPGEYVEQPANDELVGCIERELSFRRKLYPRWVKDGKITAVKAAREIWLLETIRNILAAREGRG